MIPEFDDGNFLPDGLSLRTPAEPFHDFVPSRKIFTGFLPDALSLRQTVRKPSTTTGSSGQQYMSQPSRLFNISVSTSS
jgi:hypothetical protein